MSDLPPDNLPSRSLRTCVSCRHLEHLGQFQAIPGLPESTGERWRCRKYGEEAEEFPYFPTGTGTVVELPEAVPQLCPGWEWWQDVG